MWVCSVEITRFLHPKFECDENVSVLDGRKLDCFISFLVWRHKRGFIKLFRVAYSLVGIWTSGRALFWLHSLDHNIIV